MPISGYEYKLCACACACVYVCVCVCVFVCVCVCVLFTMVWRITRWTRDRQPLPSLKELRAHRDGSMGKAETANPLEPRYGKMTFNFLPARQARDASANIWQRHLWLGWGSTLFTGLNIRSELPKIIDIYEEKYHHIESYDFEITILFLSLIQTFHYSTKWWV